MRLKRKKGFMSIETMVVIGLVIGFGVGLITLLNNVGNQQVEKSINYYNEKVTNSEAVTSIFH